MRLGGGGPLDRCLAGLLLELHLPPQADPNRPRADLLPVRLLPGLCVGLVLLQATAATLPLTGFLHPDPPRLYLSLLVLLARLYSHASQLDQTQRADLWLTRVLVLNGIALAAGWVEVLVIQDLTRTLKYQGELDDETTALVGLSLLAARLVLYFAVEQTFLDRFVRHMVAQYFVYPWALIWMLVQQASQASGVVSETTSAYTISLLVVAVAMVVAKVVLNSIYACARRIKYPEQEVTYQYM